MTLNRSAVRSVWLSLVVTLLPGVWVLVVRRGVVPAGPPDHLPPYRPVAEPRVPGCGTLFVVDTTLLTVRTGSTEVVHDLTPDCRSFVAGRGDGLLHVFVPHATAGVAVLELGAGSDDDLLAALRDLLPADDRWRHRHGSRGHGRSHVLPALVPPYATLPVLSGELALGTWQSVALVDLNTDNGVRQVRLSFLAG
jgi:secondary thiamine-phosphate synthase enzyme